MAEELRPTPAQASDGDQQPPSDQEQAEKGSGQGLPPTRPWTKSDQEKAAENDTAHANRKVPVVERPSPPPRHSWPQIEGYEILGILGQGAMGVVYQARQKKLNRLVALKMILAGPHASQEAMSRFAVEAAAAGRLQHPNIVQVYDLGEWQSQPYFAMEYVDGGHLAGRLAQASVSYHEAANLVEQLARGVHYAHDCGVVHRDLKPTNVLMSRDGVPKIADFGLAKHSEGEIQLTASGDILGTPGYLSPEQAEGKSKEVGPACDIYSLGVILYELLTGRRPFEGRSKMQILQDVIHKDPPSPAWLNPGVPRDLETICLKCLQKDPQRRYASAGDLAGDLRRFRNGEAILARPVSTLERCVRTVRRRPATTISVVVLMVLLVLGGLRGWNYLAYERPYVQHFRNCFFRFDVAHGVGPISASQAKHRYMTCRLTRRGFKGPVEKLEVINGRGVLHPEIGVEASIASGSDEQGSRRVCLVEYERDANGKLLRQIARDRAGRHVWTFLMTSDTAGYYQDKDGNPRPQAGSGAIGVKFSFTPQGHCTRQEFRDFLGTRLQPNANGSFGHAVEIDDRGFPVLVTNLGPDGQPALHNFGYVGYRQTYDDAGNVTEVQYVDAAGRPTTTRFGYSRYTIQYDQHDNIIDYAYFDTLGQPTIDNQGYARATRSYDEFGNIVEEAYWDADGQPAHTTFGYCRWTGKYDERGNRIVTDFLGPNGRPALSMEGHSRWTAEYDEAGNRTEVAYFGIDEKPALHPGGYARTTSRYDANGYVIESRYYGTDGRLTTGDEGYARSAVTYDGRGNVLKMAYFDEQGEPALHSDGNASWTASYDPRGNRIEMSFFGTDGRPVIIDGGYASWTAQYDELGYNTEKSYFDADAKPTLCDEGYHRWTAKYDARGSVLEESNFGTDNNLILNTALYAGFVAEYDGRGYRTLISYYDDQHRPTEEYATVRRKHDDRGNVIEEAYFDGEGNPVPTKEGIARFTASYDDLGHQIAKYFFDVTRNPTLHRDGHAGIKARFDDRGNQIEQAYLGTDGKLTTVPEGIAGWTARYDSRGNIVELHYFDVNRNPAIHADGRAGFRAVYDDRGNLLESTALGLDDKPKRFNQLYAIRRCTYNDRGQLVSEAYFDEQQRPTVSANGVGSAVYEYDQHGNQIRVALFAPDGAPARHYEGHSILERKYDPRGNLIYERFLDEKENPFKNSNGVYAWRAKYDNRGNRIEERYLGIDGEPAVATDGVAGWTAVYDSRGNKVEQSYFDLEGNLVIGDEGFAKWAASYDNRNLPVETARFGTDEKPMLVRGENWHKQTMRYDNRGNMVAAEFFGVDGKPIQTARGYSRWVSEFDSLGRHLRRTYFDVNGEPVPVRVVIETALPGRQGQRVGLRAGDVLVAYDGVPVTDVTTLIDRRKREFDAFAPHVLEVERDGEPLRFTVRPGLMGLVLTDRVAGADGSPDKSTPPEPTP